MMFQLNILFLVFFVFEVCRSDGSTLGVPPSKLLLYVPNKDFTCFDGSLNIPFKYINDDFCDCSDGSDEPGTSACINSLFYCENKGYYSINIPSSRVNDGICDCCDGSDEYLLKNCSDTCNILGAQALAEAERIADLINQGNSLRLQMSNTGKQLKHQKQERIAELKKELGEAERVKKDAEDLKITAETKETAALEVYRELEEKRKLAEAELEKKASEEEAKEVFNEIDANSDLLLVAEEIFNKLKTLRTSESKSDSSLEEEAKFIMNGKTELKFEEFSEHTWNHLKSILVMNDDTVNVEPEETQVNSAQLNSEKYPDDQDTDNEDKTNDETDNMDEEEQDQESDGEEYHQPVPLSDIESNYDDHTKLLIDEANRARQKFEEAEKAFSQIEREMTKLNEYLEKDFGPEDEYSPLEGQCFTYSDREYNYKLCPFDQVVQSGKQGGSETRLGVWKGWESSGTYNAMIYDRGQSCWNGPQRSVKVNLSCGLENEVFSAAEPNKCEYVLDFKTPAACKPSKLQTKETIRDEL